MEVVLLFVHDHRPAADRRADRRLARLRLDRSSCWCFSDTSLASIAQSFYQAMAGHYTLLAIPFFILASTFMSTGGVAQRIIRFSIACVGPLAAAGSPSRASSPA